MSLFYLSHAPKNPTNETRAIFMLHGVGSNEQDLFWLKEYFPDFYIFSLRGPFLRGPNSYAWYPVDFSTGKALYSFHEVEKSIDFLLETLQQLQGEYHISSENSYLLGFSQWSIMSYVFGAMHSEKIGGILWLSGRLLEEISTHAITNKKLRIFIGHGIHDTTISSIESEKAGEFFRSNWLVPDNYRYQIGHTISKEEITDIHQWLQKNPLT